MSENLLKDEEIEITLLRSVNQDLSKFFILLIDIKETMFVYPTTREVFKLFKKTNFKEISHYTYDGLNFYIQAALSKEKESIPIDHNVLKSICSQPTSKVGVTDIMLWLNLFKTKFTVNRSKLICQKGLENRTIKDVENTANLLTKLLSLNRGPVKNDFKAIAEKLKNMKDPFPTNMEKLKHVIGGYYRTEINFFHGLQSHGKSALLSWEISESVKKSKKTARIFLSEMSEQVYWTRILSKDLKTPMPLHEAELTEEHIAYLEEVYSSNLVIRSGFTAEEMVAEMIHDPRDMEAIDSLQYISRKDDNGTTTRIMHELNIFQSAIINTSASMIIVSHINENAVKAMIDKYKAGGDANLLYSYCIPTDDMMSWSSASKQLGRRNIGILSPFKITGSSSDKNKLFLSLNKNTHGATTKFKLLFNPEITSFGNLL